jgi:hypothetical protein
MNHGGNPNPHKGIHCMRKLLLPVAALVASVSLHAADDLRSNVGIGVGTMIFEGQSGLLSQICAATTNGCFGNQTFAITTGTLGAKPWTGIVSNGEVQSFVRDNMDQLAREMAAGQGESIETLAELIAVPAAERATFAQNLQAHFGQIYSSPTVTSTEVVENLAKVVEKA